MLDRLAIAALLREIAEYAALERGANPYRSRAYARAAETVERSSDELGELLRDGRLTELEGVGEAIAELITTLARTGTAPLLERLRAEIPPGRLALSRLDGLTDKRIEALASAGIEDLEGLRAALAAGGVAGLKGFGAKAEEKIRASLLRHDRGAETIALYDALPIAERVAAHLAADPAILELSIAGSLRRRLEWMREVELVASTRDPEAALERFTGGPEVRAVLGRGPAQAEVALASGARVALYLAAPERFGSELLARTGDEAHLAALGDVSGPHATEAELYAARGLPFFPPETRAGAPDPRVLEELVELGDVRGFVHVHSTFSDGRDGVLALAEEADRRGIEYLTITDHSPSAFYARGVKLDQLQRQWDEIERVQAQVKVRLLRGTESDILADGSLDYPDEILSRLEVVIASIHSRHQMDAEAMTARLVRAMKHPVFKIWGHALGRRVLERDPIRCDVEAVLDAIASSRAAIEINGDPHRLDLAPEWIPAARARGIPFVISVDAHSVAGLDALRYGVWMARRGGLQRREVLNTLDADAFARRVRP